VEGRFVIEDQAGSLAPWGVDFAGVPFVFEARVGHYTFVATAFTVRVYDDELEMLDVYSLETRSGLLTGPSTSLAGQHMTLGLQGPTSIYRGPPYATLAAEFSLYTSWRVLDLANLRATLVSLTPVPERSVVGLARTGCLVGLMRRWGAVADGFG
jgi:hypothetical protein